MRICVLKLYLNGLTTYQLSVGDGTRGENMAGNMSKCLIIKKICSSSYFIITLFVRKALQRHQMNGQWLSWIAFQISRNVIIVLYLDYLLIYDRL